LYKGSLNRRYPEELRGNFTLISGEIKTNIASSAGVVDAAIDAAINSHKPDFIIIDTAAGVHCNVIHALLDTHIAFAVTEPTPLGAHDLRLIIKLLKKLGIDSHILNRSGIGDNTTYIKYLRNQRYQSWLKYPILKLFSAPIQKGNPLKSQA